MIDLTHFLVYKTIQKQQNSLKKTKGTKYSHKSVILWKFSLLNLLQTFRSRGVILFFLRTTSGERKSELIQTDCKEEERLGRREEKKDDRGRVHCILKLPFQEFPISSPLFNNKQSHSLTGKSKWYCVNCQSRRREKRQIARSKIPSQFLLIFFLPRFSPSFLAASPLAPYERSRTTVTQ